MVYGHGLFKRFAISLAFIAVLVAPALLAGCGGNSPESAVSKYFSAWQGRDWDAFKAAVVPQKLTNDQEVLAREKFGEVKVKVEGLKMSTEYDQLDKNRARVVLADGKITYTAKILGETKTDTEDLKKIEKEFRTYTVVRVDGVWYVDTKLG